MRKKLTRLTQPMVRENGALRPATWDEALDRAAGGFDAVRAAGNPNAFGLFSCSKATNEVNFMDTEVHARCHGHQQHRQLQPDLTRTQRRRSGDGVRGRGGTSSYREVEETDLIFLGARTLGKPIRSSSTAR